MMTGFKRSFYLGFLFLLTCYKIRHAHYRKVRRNIYSSTYGKLLNIYHLSDSGNTRLNKAYKGTLNYGGVCQCARGDPPSGQWVHPGSPKQMIRDLPLLSFYCSKIPQFHLTPRVRPCVGPGVRIVKTQPLYSRLFIIIPQNCKSVVKKPENVNYLGIWEYFKRNPNQSINQQPIRDGV